jgi:cytochrome b
MREQAVADATVRVKVWDGWIRAVHWTIAVLIGVSFWSGTEQRWDIHLPSGYAILTLLLFRLAWGIVGSDWARFARFLRSPAEGFRHLAQLRRREPDTELGHNAAGGWMVLALLGVLLLQTGSGLFADNDIYDGGNGPLSRHVPGAVSDRLTGIHILNAKLILAAVALHVLVVLAYWTVNGQDLIRPMVTGVKRLPAAFAARAPRLGHPVLAAALLGAAAFTVWGITRVG